MGTDGDSAGGDDWAAIQALPLTPDSPCWPLPSAMVRPPATSPPARPAMAATASPEDGLLSCGSGRAPTSPSVPRERWATGEMWATGEVGQSRGGPRETCAKGDVCHGRGAPWCQGRGAGAPRAATEAAILEGGGGYPVALCRPRWEARLPTPPGRRVDARRGLWQRAAVASERHPHLAGTTLAGGAGAGSSSRATCAVGGARDVGSVTPLRLWCATLSTNNGGGAGVRPFGQKLGGVGRYRSALRWGRRGSRRTARACPRLGPTWPPHAPARGVGGVP